MLSGHALLVLLLHLAAATAGALTKRKQFGECDPRTALLPPPAAAAALLAAAPGSLPSCTTATSGSNSGSSSSTSTSSAVLPLEQLHVLPAATPVAVALPPLHSCCLTGTQAAGCCAAAMAAPHSASAAAACCATAGSLWLRWRRRIWRHTGSSPETCMEQRISSSCQV
jgi:hypothetical protein